MKLTSWTQQLNQLIKVDDLFFFFLEKINSIFCCVALSFAISLAPSWHWLSIYDGHSPCN